MTPSSEAPGLRLSIVLSIFAEGQTITEIVDGLQELVGPKLEEIILLVAGPAPDETVRISDEAAARYDNVHVSRQKRNPGLGLAVRQGIEEARGTHILLIDSDGEMDVNSVPLMVDLLEERGLDMVVASRWMRGGGVVGYGRLKYFLNRGFQMLFRILFRAPIHDLTLGFKLVRADLMKAIPWRSEFHDIGIETTMRPLRAGCAAGEVPTVWRRRKEGVSSNPFLNNFKYVRMAIAILFEKPAVRVQDLANKSS